MADFCTKCHHGKGFPGNPDIDIEKIFESLKEGYMLEADSICEGCGLVAIAKENGECIALARESSDDSLVWNPYGA